MPSKIRIDSAQGKLELFFGIILFIAGIAAGVALLFMSMLLSWWIILPIVFMFISPCVIVHAFSEITEENKTEIKRLEGESEEDYQKAVELNNILEDLHRYGKGERIQEKSSILFKQLKSSQTAHFILVLKAEIKDKPEKFSFLSILRSLFCISPNSHTPRPLIEQLNTSPDKFETTVIGLLEEADKAFNSIAKSSSEAVEDKSFIFKRLFTGIVSKTEITRKVFTGTVTIKLSPNEPKYKEVTKQLVLFGTNPDGKCVDYCMGMWNREETFATITPYSNNGLFKGVMFDMVESENKDFDENPEIKTLLTEFKTLEKMDDAERVVQKKQERFKELENKLKQRKKIIASYDDDEKFMDFFKKAKRDKWLSLNFFGVIFCNEVRRDGKKLVAWELHRPNCRKNTWNPNSNEIYATNNPEPKEHYLHALGIGRHESRLVEIDDYEELINGKRHENRFQLCQSQATYELYKATWIRHS